MASKYQQLQHYKGSLYGNIEYSGLEYDFETPDNVVVSSPGGVSATQHHYTKGIYSPASSYWDIYGGEDPAYPYGEFGNVYQTGHAASYEEGVFPQPRDQMYTQNQSTGMTRRENFTRTKGSADMTPIEIVPTPDVGTSPSGGQSGGPKMEGVIKIANPGLVFVLFVLLYAAFSFWINASEEFIVKTFRGGEKLDWRWYLAAAVILTIIFIIIVKYYDVPLAKLV